MSLNEKYTIHDVAKQAGVSAATVSRVMTGSNYPVGVDTRTQVLEAAKLLAYLPEERNRVKRQVFEEIAIVIPSITNPYYSMLLEGATKVLSKHQRCIYICNTDGNVEQEKLFIESLKAKRIKGVIISSIAKEYDHIRSLIQYGMELVFFDQTVDMDCNKIIFNYEKGGYMATEHLIGLGHRRIAFMGLPLTRQSRKSLFDGYKACLTKYNIGFDSNLIKILDASSPATSLSVQDHAELLIEEVMANDDLPTAIFCLNDLLALWIMRGLEKRGVKVPGDISVMGFDNIDMGMFVNPKLSTIDQCAYEMGAMAAEMLVSSFKDNTRQCVTIFMEPKLIARETTAPPSTIKKSEKLTPEADQASLT